MPNQLTQDRPVENFAFALARRALIQGIPYSPQDRPGDVASQHVLAAQELGRGFPQDRSEFAALIRGQQVSFSEDVRALWSEPEAQAVADTILAKAHGGGVQNAPVERPH